MKNHHTAKFLGSYKHNEYGKCIIELEYEYKGHKYSIEDNRSQGSMPLYMQHKLAQDNIDSEIEKEKLYKEQYKKCEELENAGIHRETIDEALNKLFGYWES